MRYSDWARELSCRYNMMSVEDEPRGLKHEVDNWV